MKDTKLYQANHTLGNCISTLNALFDARKYPLPEERVEKLDELQETCLGRLVGVKQALEELLTEGKIE